MKILVKAIDRRPSPGTVKLRESLLTALLASVRRPSDATAEQLQLCSASPSCCWVRMVEQFYQSDRVLLPQTWDIVYNKSNKSDDLHLEIVHQKTGQTLAGRTGAMIVSAAPCWLRSGQPRSGPSVKVNNSSVSRPTLNSSSVPQLFNHKLCPWSVF